MYFMNLYNQKPETPNWLTDPTNDNAFSIEENII